MESLLTQLLGMSARQLSSHLESLGVSADESTRGNKADKIMRILAKQRSDHPGEASDAAGLQARVEELLRTEDGNAAEAGPAGPAAGVEPGNTDDGAVSAEIRATQQRIRLLQLRREEAALLAELAEPRQAASRVAGNFPGEWQSALHAILGSGSRDAFDPQSDPKPSKPLLVSDFVSKESTDSTLVHSRSGDLVFKGSKPVGAENISLAQWIVGNAKILDRLLSNGQLIRTGADGKPDITELRRYLRYNIQIGELAEAGFATPRIMRFDESYRVNQHNNDLPWATESFQLLARHLLAPDSDPRTLKPKAFQPSAGRQFCFNFNANRCFRKACHFLHACRICRGNHPACAHDSGSGQEPSGTKN